MIWERVLVKLLTHLRTKINYFINYAKNSRSKLKICRCQEKIPPPVPGNTRLTITAAYCLPLGYLLTAYLMELEDGGIQPLNEL